MVNVCLVLIDFQQAFLKGQWARYYGIDQVQEISDAGLRLARLFKTGALKDIPVVCSRCYLDSPDCDPPDELVEPFSKIDYVWKPTTNILLARGFREWMEQQLKSGCRTLVVGGCTTTSCVRVSSQAIQAEYSSVGMQVVVDLSICGARSGNYDPHQSEADPVLVSTYGKLVHGRSAVDLAIIQMQNAGVKVVQEVDWSAL